MKKNLLNFEPNSQIFSNQETVSPLAFSIAHIKAHCTSSFSVACWEVVAVLALHNVRNFLQFTYIQEAFPKERELAREQGSAPHT